MWCNDEPRADMTALDHIHGKTVARRSSALFRSPPPTPIETKRTVPWRSAHQRPPLTPPSARLQPHLEPAILANLAERWHRGGDRGSGRGSRGDGSTREPYTFMSVVLISLNPCEWLPNPTFDE